MSEAFNWFESWSPANTTFRKQQSKLKAGQNDAGIATSLQYFLETSYTPRRYFTECSRFVSDCSLSS